MDSWTTNLSSVFESAGSFITDIEVAAEHNLVVTTDTLIEDVHFPKNTPAHAIGYKSLAVNLSDLAAMGATPHSCGLMLMLPDYNEQWIEQFVKGWHELAMQYRLPLSEIQVQQSSRKVEAHVTAFGTLTTDQGLYRHSAQVGDLIYVSGALGEAAAGLNIELNADPTSEPNRESKSIKQLVSRLRYPNPRVSLGQALNGIANACLDVSDGLIADVGHIAERSNVNVELLCDEIYLSASLQNYCATSDNNFCALDYALAGGDDYELCFTVPPANITLLEKIVNSEQTHICCIGKIVSHRKKQQAENRVMIFDPDGKLFQPKINSYEHFS